MSRVVEIRGLPDGRIRIHFFVFNSQGAIQLPVSPDPGPVRGGSVLPDEDGNHVSRGYIACDRAKSSILPVKQKGTIRPTVHSDDARAVTCPECKETQEWKAMMARLSELVTPRG